MNSAPSSDKCSATSPSSCFVGCGQNCKTPAPGADCKCAYSEETTVIDAMGTQTTDRGFYTDILGPRIGHFAQDLGLGFEFLKLV